MIEAGIFNKDLISFVNNNYLPRYSIPEFLSSDSRCKNTTFMSFINNNTYIQLNSEK